jgi:hypothetical protein
MIKSFDWGRVCDGQIEDACEFVEISATADGSYRLSRSTIATSLSRLLLDPFHIGFEPVEAGLPDRALLGQPTFGLGHGSWFQPTGTDTPTLLRLHEAASFKHPDVLHQAGQRHGKWSGEFPDRGLSLAQSRKDRSPGRVRKSAEHMVKMR